MPIFSRETAYHEAAHVAAWHLEDGVQVDVTLDPKNPRVTVSNRLPPVTSRHVGIHRAYVRIRAGLAGAFAERVLLGDPTAWLPTTRDAAPDEHDRSVFDFHAISNELTWAMGEHGISDAAADVLYGQAVTELTALFQVQAFTDRVRRIGDYLATVERGGHVFDDKLREVEKGCGDE